MDSILDFISDNFTYLGLALIVLFALFQIRRRNAQTEYAKKILEKSINTNTNEPLTLHPEINTNLCAGCAACTRVCPEGDILKMIDHKAVLVSPTKCVGHGECERACPTGAISLVFGTLTRGMDIPRISSNYETNISGLYIAGELGGMGLIRNAIKQGSIAAVHALANLPHAGVADVDVLVVGAGPAGLAASLAAIAGKKRYICIEQNSFGGTVYNFPRQKIVMTHPADLPAVGKMKFSKNKVSKEELLAFWSDVKKKTGLKIAEGVRFESLEKKGDIFYVKTSKGEIKAKKVILCMGVRGSPRKLGLPNEDLPKVTYNLIDPEQYQGMDIAVVGGGNAGVEAAQYLAKAKYKNRVTLLVRGPTFDRCNEENKNIIENMAKNGLVNIRFQSSVAKIESKSLIIKSEPGEEKIPNDYLFVFAGAEMPHKFLMGLGVKIDKKFGQT